MVEFNIPGRNSQFSSESCGAYVPWVLRMALRKFGNNVSSNKLRRASETRAYVGYYSLRSPRPSKRHEIGRALKNRSIGFSKERPAVPNEEDRAGTLQATSSPTIVQSPWLLRTTADATATLPKTPLLSLFNP
ncbi:hypothetical protein EG68_04913 [Paragonimus skrjabini miyazakii]|uniref:Uncharacterized protein n=1 Tax=Paragonimus skrjabini miyazakii TaxID=59628 RepID=A0A8S9YX96_9TREM|nr:hypothetical protein EG68_04913 [Paragonimus skrjabini miyazakii]